MSSHTYAVRCDDLVVEIASELDRRISHATMTVVGCREKNRRTGHRRLFKKTTVSAIDRKKLYGKRGGEHTLFRRRINRRVGHISFEFELLGHGCGHSGR